MIQEAQRVRRAEEVPYQNGLEQAIDRYKQSDSFLVLSKGTRLGYTADLAQFQGYCQVNAIQTINRLSSRSVENWRDQLRQGGYAPATINRKRASLSTFLNWAQAEGIIRPDFTIGLSKHEPAGKKQSRILSVEQVNSLISKAKNFRDASLILIALTTGATITEIVNLNAEDILRTEDGNILIRFKGGVQKTQPRTLVVGKKAGSRIAEYIKDSGLKPENPLFKGVHGHGRLTRQGFNFILNEYTPEIGVENLNPRMLRNTFIANFAGTPRELDAILGRRNPEPARSTYSPRRLLKI